MGCFKPASVISVAVYKTCVKPVPIPTEESCIIYLGFLNTVEPLNKGHFGSKAFVLYSEVVLWWEV